MNQFNKLATSVKRKLAVRFGLAFLLVAFFGLYSIRFYMERTAAYNRILLMEDLSSPEAFSPGQLQYISDHISSIEDRMLKELIISNVIIVVIFSFFSYLLSQGLFESLAESVERERRFLDDASHELRTPLAAIASVSETTLRSQNNRTKDYQEALQQIHEESKRLSGTLRDFLFLSQGDHKKIQLDIKEQNLDKIVASLVKSMQPVATEKSITLETEGVDKAVTLMADGGKIRQLLTILLDNAIKYSENNSRVVVRLDDKPKVKVSITDFGHGISSRDLPHIFERFYRSDKSRTKSRSGLGLSIAKWIAEEHNIKIGVKSRPGKGSTFSLTF